MLNQTYDFGAQTHLGAGVMSTAAVVQVLTSTFVGSTALRKAHKVSDYTALNAIVH